MANFVKGGLVRISGTFAVSGVPTNAGAVTIRVRKPATAVEDVYTSATTPAVVNSATGSYYVELEADVEGPWYYRVEGTAPAKGASEGNLQVVSDYY